MAATVKRFNYIAWDSNQWLQDARCRCIHWAVRPLKRKRFDDAPTTKVRRCLESRFETIYTEDFVINNSKLGNLIGHLEQANLYEILLRQLHISLWFIGVRCVKQGTSNLLCSLEVQKQRTISGCGTVGRGVASDNRDPRFESSRRRFSFSVNCIETRK